LDHENVLHSSVQVHDYETFSESKTSARRIVSADFTVFLLYFRHWRRKADATPTDASMRTAVLLQKITTNSTCGEISLYVL